MNTDHKIQGVKRSLEVLQTSPPPSPTLTIHGNMSPGPMRKQFNSGHQRRVNPSPLNSLSNGQTSTSKLTGDPSPLVEPKSKTTTTTSQTCPSLSLPMTNSL